MYCVSPFWESFPNQSSPRGVDEAFEKVRLYLSLGTGLESDFRMSFSFSHSQSNIETR
ncbi:predicted protein [Botrytis cinerea T4]|uniref:Uncharacterized protein n=1 Tax=Botryotinia fuckeliana (strain T4) TaxID=999810 RepID=G2Y1J8_BOTF4|nr:predicted protein [Botrytis cinerea T4]